MRAATLLSISVMSLSLVQAAAAQTYRQIPGVQEFSGRVLVRPKQADQLLREKPNDVDRLVTVPDRAIRRIRPNVVRYLSALDIYVVRVPRGYSENTYIRELNRTGEYEYAQPDWKTFPDRAKKQQVTPNDPLFAQQWHHQNLNSELAWALWTGDDTVTTAYTDTGFFKTHVDLQSLYVPGYNAVQRRTEASGGDVSDIDGHGTHVAGCGSAHGNNGIGVSGVGWNFRIMPIKIVDGGNGFALISDQIDGARWAAENGAKTVNTSFGGVSSPAVGTTGTYIKSLDALYFRSAGNSQENWSGFFWPDLICVGATDPGNALTGFTGHGRGVTLYAPGQGILSTTNDGAYAPFDGTSMATPITSGLAALLFSANPGLSADDVQDIIQRTAAPINDTRVINYGLINVFDALSEALVTAPVQAEVTAVNATFGSYLSGGVPDVKAPSLNDVFAVRAAQQGTTGTATRTEFTLNLPDYVNGAFLDGRELARVTIEIQARASAGPVTGMLYAKRPNGTWAMISAKPIPSNNFGTWSYRLPLDQSFIAPDGRIELTLRTVAPQRLRLKNYSVQIGYAYASVSKRRVNVAP